MGIFNDLFGGFFKKSSQNGKTRSANDDVPVMGRQDDADQEALVEQDMPTMTNQRSQESAGFIDHELPSVNRSRPANKLGTWLGYALLIGGGIAMLYAILGPEKEVKKAPKKWNISNNMPKIEAPRIAPTPPPPPKRIAPIAKPPLTAATEKKVPAKRKPDWTDRKRGGNSVQSVGGVTAKENAGKQESNGQVSTKNDAVNPNESGWLAVKLKSIATPDSYAQILPNRDYLITKGTSLDCALETAVDSTLSGLTTCRLTRDIYSDNGRVVLLDRGSQLVGEYQGGLAQGQARIFVLWTRAKTPKGVIIQLDSPGAGPLGRTGHDGFIDRHFLERFGAAVIYSIVRDSLLIAQKNNSTNVTIGGNGTDQVALEMLKSTVNIPPTLNINQGAHIQIMVARDLDFSSVYALDIKE